MYKKQTIGKIGENIAVEYLQKRKYKILERNFRTRRGEIDIIVYDETKKELVFVEVKTRSSVKYGQPSEAVKKIKQKHIIEASKYYNYKYKVHNTPIRFDIIEVFLNNSTYRVNHIEKAFEELIKM